AASSAAMLLGAVSSKVAVLGALITDVALAISPRMGLKQVFNVGSKHHALKDLACLSTGQMQFHRN
ncbi:MAG: hypothetical protein AAFU71_01965, partial [Cyanobacteria bacterium J06632_22]